MNERSLSLLDQYDIEVLRTKKGRGTFICETKLGNLIFQEYTGNPEKLKLQQNLLQRIKELGLVKTEEIIPDKEGMLYVKDTEGCCYILKSYFEGSECDIYDPRECVDAIQLLARLHHSMDDTMLCEDAGQIYSPLQEYEKHNRELARVWSYLKKKGQKHIFEVRLLGVMEYFVDQARHATEGIKDLEAKKGTSELSLPIYICHGDYQYHNIIRTQEGWRIINFEKILNDNPIRDIYLFLRKVLEKNDWSLSLGRDLLHAYEAIRILDDYSKMELYYRFAYPEKFWKIVNFYYNSSKVWIPEKHFEKLEKVIYQENLKQKFLEEFLEKL